MASKRELEALIILAGKIDPSLRNAIKGAEKSTKKIGESSKWLGKVSEKAWDKLKEAVKWGATGITGAMIAVGIQGIKLASDLTEVQNVVDVTFGDSASKINAWSKTAKNGYGLSELAAKQYTGTMGAMLKSTGISTKYLVEMSEAMAGLTGDFSSFYNLSTEEAFEKIRSGISGETEPLKALGINLSVANLEAYALSKGITTAYDKMSEADKTILRYNYLLNASKDAQGDFARTSGSFANQLRLLKTNFGETAAKIMNSTLPAFTQLFQKGNSLMTSFSDNPAKIQEVSNKVAAFVDKAISLIPAATQALKDFGGVVWDVSGAAYDLYQWMDQNWSTIKPLIYGIAGAMIFWKGTMGAIAFYEMATKAATIATQLFSLAKYKDIAATLFLQGLYAKDAIVRGIWTGIMWASTAATWATTAATSALSIAMAILTAPITLVILAIAALVAASIWLYKNWDKVTAFLSSTWDTVKQAFVVGINYIVDKINWLIQKMNKIPGVEIPLIPKMGEGTSEASVATMDRYAVGGFANRPSIFGEAGPEAAIPLKRTPRSLSLLNQTASALGVGPTTGGSPVFVFSPVVGGGANTASLRSALGDTFEEFKAMCDEWWESKRRESFG